MAARRPLHPHERSFLEGYVLGTQAGLVSAQVHDDTRGAWSASDESAGELTVQHHGGARAVLSVKAGVVTHVRWLDDTAADEPKPLDVEQLAAAVGQVLEGPELRAAILRSDLGARSPYHPDIAAWALSVLVHLAENTGSVRTEPLRELLRRARLGLGAGERGVLAAELRSVLDNATSPALRTVGEDTAHCLALGAPSAAFPREVLRDLGDPPWAAFSLAACAVGASVCTRDVALYPVAAPSVDHGVLWLAQRKLTAATGSLAACLAALPSRQREELLRAMAAIRGARRGRISVPKAPRLEPSCSLGAHAVVGDDLWLGSPQGISVRALPHLEHVRDVALEHRADALAASADGRLVAVLSRGEGEKRNVQVLEASSGRVLLAFEGELSGNQSSIALSARGRLLVLSGSISSYVWELDGDGRGLRSASPRRYSGLIAPTPDEAALLQGDEREVALVALDPPPGAPARTPLFPTGWFTTALACAPDGGSYAVAHGRGPSRVELVDAESGERRLCFTQAHDVSGLAFSPDGELAAVDYHGALRLLDRRGRVRRHLASGAGRVSWTAKGQVVAGWARPQVVDGASGLVLAAFGVSPGGPHRVESLAFAGDVLFTEAGRVGPPVRRSWDLESGLELGPPPTIERAFVDPRVSMDGTFRVEAVETTHTRVMGDVVPVHGGVDLVPTRHDGAEGPRVRLAEHADEVTCLAVSRTSDVVLSAGGGAARVWLVATSRSVSVGKGIAVKHVAFDAEHRGVALFGEGRRGEPEARLCTFEDEVLAAREGDVVAVAGHVGAGLLVVARPGGTLEVVRGGEVVARDGIHRADVTALVVSPCGRMVASVDRDGVVRVTEVPRPG